MQRRCDDFLSVHMHFQKFKELRSFEAETLNQWDNKFYLDIWDISANQRSHFCSFLHPSGSRVYKQAYQTGHRTVPKYFAGEHAVTHFRDLVTGQTDDASLSGGSRFL